MISLAHELFMSEHYPVTLKDLKIMGFTVFSTPRGHNTNPPPAHKKKFARTNEDQIW